MKEKMMAVMQKMMTLLKEKIMPNRKRIIFLSAIVLVAAGAAAFYTMKPDTSAAGFQKMLDTQERINALLASPEYMDAAQEEKLEKAKALVDELRKERLIRSVSYDSHTLTFSFEYANGILGGISLKDFSTQPGEMPMD